MLDGSLPGYWLDVIATFTAANTTKAKILVDVSPPQVAPAVSGENPLPGESAVRQRVLTGGCRLVEGQITSTDNVDKSLLVYRGIQTSLYANMGVVTTTATTNATITRTVGSFIADGLKVGDSGMCFGAVSDANNGSIFTVTAVTDLQLTLSGVTGISIAETQGTGFRVIKVAQVGRKAIVATSGASDTKASVPLIGGIYDGRIDFTGTSFGSTGMLIVGLAATASASGIISVSGVVGLY